MNFHINEEYLTDIQVRTEYGPRINRNDPSHDDLIEVLKNPYTSYSIGTEDHPEFARLRIQLEQLGYIQCERNWVNGDRVLKLFSLNGVKFKSGVQFPCAAALGFHLKSRKKYQEKKGGQDA
jgi:hypothetical protein